MSAKTAHVEGGVIPAAACLCRVISAVFIQVEIPNKRVGVCLGLASQLLTHCSVGLENTASHATKQSADCGADAHRSRSRLDLGGGEEENGTLRRRLDPRLCTPGE